MQRQSQNNEFYTIYQIFVYFMIINNHLFYQFIQISMDLPNKSSQTNPSMNEQGKKLYDVFPQNIKNFYNFHGVQMYGSQFPMSLVRTLYSKLSKATSDVGQYFEIIDSEENNTFQVRAKKDLQEQGNVFVVDHALTFRYPDLRKLLSQNTSLIPRLTEMIKYHKEPKFLNVQNFEEEKPMPSSSNLTEIQFDGMDLTQLGHLQFPNNTVTLSLISNQLTNEEQLIKKLEYLQPKALWINNNPIEQSQAIAEYVKNKTKIEIYNSKFTKNCTEWGLKYAQKRNITYAFDQSPKNISRLNLDGRGIFQINTKVFNQFTNLHDLSIKGHEISDENHRKIIKQIIETNKNLNSLKVDYEAEMVIYELFKMGQISQEAAKRILINGHSLFCKEPTAVDLQIDQIQQDIFKIAGSYRLASSEQLDQTSIWYVNDQLGSAIQHGDVFNVKMVPFLYSEDNKLGQNMWAYSIIWPTRNIKKGEFVYRDYLLGYNEQSQRSSRLAIWYDVPSSFYINRYNVYQNQLKELQKQAPTRIAKFYSQNTENQRKLIKKRSDLEQMYPQRRRILTDSEIIQQNTSHKQIQFVKNLQEAQVVWLCGALDEDTWPEYKQKYYTNQFPFQSSVVLKHNLADSIQSILGNTPFLMRTYNLQKQLLQFIGEYNKRLQKGEDNLWILKPPNMARSLDMIITDNLSIIIKNMETGPKIAQKYISKPVLRQGRKVDLRFILLVKSVNPLTMFLYKHFWIRSSNNPYTADRRYLATYQTQFTVMNYGPVSDFKQIKYLQFIEQFQKDYAPCKWSVINDKIKRMLRNTFISASLKYPEMQNDKSRAMYGIDIMIDSQTMQPKLLEITFSPDCKRACNYYPTFFNQVLETLYLDIIGENMDRVI